VRQGTGEVMAYVSIERIVLLPLPHVGKLLDKSADRLCRFGGRRGFAKLGFWRERLLKARVAGRIAPARG